MDRKVNLQAGLPESVDVRNPQELQQVIDTVLHVLRAWNGDLAHDDRVVTIQELNERLQ